jgi:hypothetical protein
LCRGEVDWNLEKMERPKDKDEGRIRAGAESARWRETRLGSGPDVWCPKSPSLALVASKISFFGVARPPQTAGGEFPFLLFFRLRAYIQMRELRTLSGLPLFMRIAGLAVTGLHVFSRMPKSIRWAKRGRLGVPVVL